ncbi:ABC transporter permease [Jidongwangia harbinensis]|uniref:ABC transporter permease n=1 Tax=Jidongwangia harbinensis TaxID=2878561 RepID=UPI001CD91C49|nr:FtsX-like permease family protein [Jidongwangia harbinensis]MCA2215960.1 ABC transporter permease [Jidongwangia harbinensis]
MLTRDRLGTFVAVLLGTAIVAATLVLLTSARPRLPDRFADLAVLVQSPAAANRPDAFAEPVPWPAGTAERLAGRLRAVPGVRAVVEDRPFYAQPVRSGRPVPGHTVGYGWSDVTGRLLDGSPPAGDRDVVVDRALGVPVGGTVTLLTASGPAPWRVTGHVGTAAVFVSGPVAARLSPGVRVLGVAGRPDPAAVRSVVGGDGTVLTGDRRAEVEPRADARTRWIGLQVLTATTALAGFAGVFLAASTSAFAVSQRRREIGLLRAVGATPRQVRAMLYRSALLVGAAASALGVGLGVLAAHLLAGRLVHAGIEPAGYTVRWWTWAPAAAFAAGPLVALLGTAAAARRASRIGPLEAMRAAEVEKRPMTRLRWLAGLAAAAAGTAAAVATAVASDVSDLAQYSMLGAMALVVAATLLAPVVIPALVGVLLRPVRGVLGMLVRESALTAVRRTASTAAPVLLTVAFAVFVTGTVQTSTAAYAARRAATVDAAAVLVPDGTPGLHDAAAGRATLRTQVYVAGTAVPALGSADLPPGTALAAPTGAGRVTVTYPDGVAETLRVTGPAPPETELVLPRASVRAHDPSALAPAAFLPARPAVTAPGAEVVDAATYAARTDTEDDRLVWTFTLLLLAVSAGAGALAVANTLLMSARQRIGDYRVLRLSGATPGQVALTAALESALVVAIGSLLGIGTALLALIGSAQSLAAQSGRAVPVVVPWPLVACVVAGCLVVAVAAGALPARAARG